MNKCNTFDDLSISKTIVQDKQFLFLHNKIGIEIINHTSHNKFRGKYDDDSEV